MKDFYYTTTTQNLSYNYVLITNYLHRSSTLSLLYRVIFCHNASTNALVSHCRHSFRIDFVHENIMRLVGAIERLDDKIRRTLEQCSRMINPSKNNQKQTRQKTWSKRKQYSTGEETLYIREPKCPKSRRKGSLRIYCRNKRTDRFEQLNLQPSVFYS